MIMQQTKRTSEGVGASPLALTTTSAGTLTMAEYHYKAQSSGEGVN